jgi:hypothetical protein
MKRLSLILLLWAVPLHSQTLVAENLPDMPQPKLESVALLVQSETPTKPRHEVNRKVFWTETSLLAGAFTADGATTAAVISRGGIETNPFFPGKRPSNAQIAGIQAALFATQAGIFSLTERSRKPWVRWTGRALIGASIISHAATAGCNGSLVGVTPPHQAPQTCAGYGLMPFHRI